MSRRQSYFMEHNVEIFYNLCIRYTTVEDNVAGIWCLACNDGYIHSKNSVYINSYENWFIQKIIENIVIYDVSCSFCFLACPTRRASHIYTCIIFYTISYFVYIGSCCFKKTGWGLHQKAGSNDSRQYFRTSGSPCKMEEGDGCDLKSSHPGPLRLRSHRRRVYIRKVHHLDVEIFC